MAYRVDVTAFYLEDGEPGDFIIGPLTASSEEAAGRRAGEILRSQLAGRIEDEVSINRVEVVDA